MEDYDTSIPNLNNVCNRCLLNTYAILGLSHVTLCALLHSNISPLEELYADTSMALDLYVCVCCVWKSTALNWLHVVILVPAACYWCMISALPSIFRGEVYVFATCMCGQAIMMYNLQRYADTMAVLEPLYRNIEPIDEVHCSCSYFCLF